MEHGLACTHPSLGGGGAGFWSPEELLTSSNGGERQTTTTRRTSNQSTAEKRPGGPEDHPEAVEQLEEAIGGAMALSSCAESAAGVGGDGIDSVDPRLPSKRGSRRTYVWARRSSWYARGGLRRCDVAELLCRRRCRRGRRRARFWSVGGAPVRKQRPAAGEKQRPAGSSRFGQRQEIHRPGAWPAAGSSRAWILRAG